MLRSANLLNTRTRVPTHRRDVTARGEERTGHSARPAFSRTNSNTNFIQQRRGGTPQAGGSKCRTLSS